ncbi:hypothetical protein [Planctomyces sp. SH-PL62]|uniref:hypothetical protein n=1 Tax=Planctomyces sp. SH-PL62 TaxID=1636152 RepID=UPI00078BA641|nr:hypothetical protein [Planctomyces sp. SH-PL62]AMV39983.1 hypothetical protein VT85_21295 [Planctomyces sp. SH-PL62]
MSRRNRPARRLESLVAFSMLALAALGNGRARGEGPPDGGVAKAVVRSQDGGSNRLDPAKWTPWDAGFVREGDAFVCDNGGSSTDRRGASQRVVLDQRQPAPIVVSASSKAEGVSGGADPDYSLYLDLVYDDGSTVWGQSSPFKTGTHDWQEARVVFIPARPIKELTVNLLMRNHAGKASFRNPRLAVVSADSGGAVFDGTPVVPKGPAREGFQVRDVAVDGDYLHIAKRAIGLELDARRSDEGGAAFLDVALRETTGRDRAVTLVYTVPVPAEGARWLEDPRRSSAVEPGREYVKSSPWPYRAGSNGRLSSYPFGAVAHEGRGTAMGIDMARPAFFRVGCNAATGELFLAYDVALTPEKPEANLRFCRFDFDPTWEFRAALDAYYRLFPAAFERRVAEQGLWMPFSPISKVKGWEDFGFRFKEGDGETAWDDAHGILTFRYTEPMTWWMAMPDGMPRTLEAAVAEAKRLAADGKREAKAWLSSAYHDRDGDPVALFRDEPWNKGAVWSMNSTPGLAADDDFSVKWNPGLRDRLYGPDRKRGELDGEYIDSSEGYVTNELDFRREHFAKSEAPLVFALDDHRPAVFRGTIAFEYARGIERDVHARGKLMMANATPDRLCWLAPLLDVMGTESDWNPGGRWRPMSDADLLLRRALCKGKPFCFLMNSDFDRLGPDKVEKYMKRAVAYGMFPGFFSHNAADGAYFTRPELYERDRPLFRKYVPIARLVAEAGWEPVTQARSSDEKVYVERFGDRHLTVFNDSNERRTVTIRLDAPKSGEGRDLARGGAVSWREGVAELSLEPEDLAVLETP